jgi:thymidylate kinase
VIAIIGPDASGKSTMVAETTRWLGSVFRVHVAHLGKPPSTWLTWLPNFAGRQLGRLAPQLRTSQQPAGRDGSGCERRRFLYRLRAVLLACDRRALAIRLARKAAQGWIVVCDRYPSAVVGAPDSARLKPPEEEAGLPWLHAFLARLENRLYREIPLPQVVIRLNAPVSVAIDRNRERQKPCKEADDFVARRHKDFFVPSFAGTPILSLDTSTSKAMSVRMLRRLLWEWLCGPAAYEPRISRSPSTSEREETRGQSPFQTNGIENERAELQKK